MHNQYLPLWRSTGKSMAISSLLSVPISITSITSPQPYIHYTGESIIRDLQQSNYAPLPIQNPIQRFLPQTHPRLAGRAAWNSLLTPTYADSSLQTSPNLRRSLSSGITVIETADSPTTDVMSDRSAPLAPAAILLPLLSFPSWILCVLPLSWHFRQGNIAAGSMILWVILMNFFNSINPLIWPRDNVNEWWDGDVWCDIHARLQVGAIVGTTASTAMIVRKLAKVMDTRYITVSSSRDDKLKEKVLDILWCWIYPLVFVLLYYIVQPVRYMIYGIIGCLSAYDTSWPSMVLSFMWAPITTLVAAGYAGKLFPFSTCQAIH
jgi:hypothetical protein